MLSVQPPFLDKKYNLKFKQNNDFQVNNNIISLVLRMNKVFTYILLSLTIGLFAQTDYSDQWEDLFSYTHIKDFVKSDNLLYAVADNAVFVYNTQTKEITKISSVHGLSGETSSAIHYSASLEKLVIGYENGLLEIIDSQGKITTSPEITNFNQTGEKRINHIYEYNDKLYLSTSFAVIVYDLKNLEFGDTYFIGIGSTDEKVNQITVFNNEIYAATQRGVYIANINSPNLVDFNEWALLFTGNYTSITTFNNRVFTTIGNELRAINETLISNISTFNQNIKGLKSSTQSLSVALETSATILNQSLTQIAQIDQTSSLQFTLNQAYEENNDIYLATQGFGILKTSTSSTNTFEQIHPEGPFLNDIFSIDVHNNNLWVVYGGYDATYTPLQRRNGYSYYNGENWTNTPYDPSFPLGDLTSITIDKTNSNNVFISSFGDITGSDTNTPLTGGLLHIEDGKVTNFYNQLNSSLQNITENIPNRVTIRIGGSAFDNEGNLWLSNIGVSHRIKKRSPNGEWRNFDIQSIIQTNRFGMNEMAIDNNNTLWIGTRRNGVYAFNENGLRKKALTTEATRGSLPNLNVRTVAVDSNNDIWLGTLTGLVVFRNASAVFDSAVNDAAPVVILDDGIPKRLLGDQTINTIEVDGANNKWFGTDTGGVLYTNSTGEKTLANFNKSNSPLPSDKILKIRVDNSTGKVYFVTSRGMVAYDSKVAPYGDELGEVYAYPNPVLKNHATVSIGGRHGTHLPEGTNVKILDVSGNLVYETNVKESQQLQGGKVVWDKRNLAGNKVASGVYIVLLSHNDNTETSTTKIAIVN